MSVSVPFQQYVIKKLWYIEPLIYLLYACKHSGHLGLYSLKVVPRGWHSRSLLGCHFIYLNTRVYILIGTPRPVLGAHVFFFFVLEIVHLRMQNDTISMYIPQN